MRFELTRHNIDKYFGHLEEHQYRHYNSALGCYIYGKDHFIYEMNKRNLIPYELAQEMASQWDSKNKKDEYSELSPKALDIIRSLKLSSDRFGNISLGSRAIKALKEIGAIKMDSPYRPDGSREGGFN